MLHQRTRPILMDILRHAIQSFLFLALTLSIQPEYLLADTGAIKMDLNNGWQFRQSGEQVWMDATVPGCVHTDLLENGKIEDPFYRTNEKNQQWIDKVDWEYKLSFDADAALLKKKNIRLTFRGLDTYASIFLNGSLLIRTDNMFREYKVDVKTVLRQKDNRLHIIFHSPVKLDELKLETLGYGLPANNDQSQNGGVGDKKLSVFARKAPYHYGWDWGPRFVTSGIWRPVILEAWDHIKIENVQFIQNQITPAAASVTAKYTISASVDQNTKMTVEIHQSSGLLASKTLEIIPGANVIDVDFNIANPQLWWCNGLGEPHLYTLNSVIKIDSVECDRNRQRIGLRTLKLIQETDGKGKSFTFELNGVPVFAKGANYIPNDNFLNRVTDEKYEHILQSAVDANMNMLRVWGGGIYENDIFYDLCDQKGIMIWQDFMFACSMYPGDDAFQQNVRQEAIDNVIRLRNHPCIALWCGNNEIYGAWAPNNKGGWGWKQRFTEEQQRIIWDDYEDLFLRIIPEIINQYDPMRPYWPSSPMAGPDQAAGYNTASGDVHYWGVWHGEKPFEHFQNAIGRFMSEYGFQSFPELATVKTYTLVEDRDINSTVMTAHQRSGIGNQRIKQYMDRYYREPKNFESLLYVGQVLQAEGIRSAIEAHRRAKPYCMGTLYWQLNDCWPVASWAGMDYYGRWKALHYFAKKAYEPILISPVQKGDSIIVQIVSDKLEDIKNARMMLTLMDFSGKNRWEITERIDIPANSSSTCFTIARSDLEAAGDLQDCCMIATLVNGRKNITQNLTYFVPPKNLNLLPPGIDYRVGRTKKGFRISIKTEKLVKNLCLSVEGINGFFSDNYFDILPRERIVITFKPQGTVSIGEFKKKLKLISLIDTY